MTKGAARGFPGLYIYGVPSGGDRRTVGSWFSNWDYNVVIRDMHHKARTLSAAHTMQCQMYLIITAIPSDCMLPNGRMNKRLFEIRMIQAWSRQPTSRIHGCYWRRCIAPVPLGRLQSTSSIRMHFCSCKEISAYLIRVYGPCIACE